MGRRTRGASYVLALVGVLSALFGDNALRWVDAASGHTVPQGVYSTVHYLVLAVAQVGVPFGAALFAASLVLKRM
ncbi:hypothetical protein [Actinocorallia sp. A-T 12471]|uniref:hypothetical protein n=1 Tax=Actinocorallia sp. A-T 12471 TaxID=3089813 RepID=UPI0029CEFAAA|nr:hypothetical protein [Actinocorallia sp. A-T 12471]MDX6738573.1 hypothetical protein [Actinocorallia sp. A-T 12471]